MMRFLHVFRHAPHPWHVLPFFFAFIGAEALWITLRRRRSYPWRELSATLGIVVLRHLGRIAQPALLAGTMRLLWSHRLLTMALPGATSVFIAFAGVEFAYYWMHRCSHRWGWLWATHSVHHSSEQMTFGAALRLGVTGSITGNGLFYAPLVLLGFRPQIVFGLLSLNLVYQFFLHTELIPKLGPIEWILNTPSHHRVHHASNADLRDRNFGGMLIVFDRLFGTFAAESQDIRLEYGLAGERRGFNPLRIAFGGWWNLCLWFFSASRAMLSIKTGVVLRRNRQLERNAS